MIIKKHDSWKEKGDKTPRKSKVAKIKNVAGSRKIRPDMLLSSKEMFLKYVTLNSESKLTSTRNILKAKIVEIKIVSKVVFIK